MSPAAELIDKRLADLEAMVFGIRGEGGLVQELRGIREDFKVYRKEERERHEGNIRQAVVSLGSACVALLAMTVTLIGVLAR